jgi:hypothetical protein
MSGLRSNSGHSYSQHAADTLGDLGQCHPDFSSSALRIRMAMEYSPLQGKQSGTSAVAVSTTDFVAAHSSAGVYNSGDNGVPMVLAAAERHTHTLIYTR